MAGGILGSVIGGVLTGGIGPAIGAVLPDVTATAKILVDRLVPDPAAREAAQKDLEQVISAREAAILQTVTAQNEAQNTLNLAEAQGNDRYSSRWRPTLGWALVAAFIYQFLAAPIVTFLGSLAGVAFGFAFPAPPTLTVSDFMPVLLGMLGLGGMRTVERIQGVPGAMPGGTKR
jgi:lipopolysaccharide export LptBFGC system permease protein LptF